MMADDRAALHRVLAEIQAARRNALNACDEHQHANLAAPAAAGPRDEQLEQSHAALVRLLTEAAKNVTDAIATIDQRDRLLAGAPPRRVAG